MTQQIRTSFRKSTDLTSAFRNPFEVAYVTSKTHRIARADLVLRLTLAADGHAPTVAGVLDVVPHAVTAQLARRAIKARWHRARETRREREGRAIWLRGWWRARLQAIGVDPATLPITDPLWSACHRRPRGALVRDVAAVMRAERPGETLATDARILELLARVAALVLLDESARRAAIAAAFAKASLSFDDS